MKGKLVWIKKYEWIEGSKVLIEDPSSWTMSFHEPTYDEALYEVFVLIPLES